MATAQRQVLYYADAGSPAAWRSAGRPPIYRVGSMQPVDRMTAFLDEQFTGGTINTGRWFAYNDSTFGAPSRVQRYMGYNTAVGAGTSGATDGTSLKLTSKRESVSGNSFTAGMVDTQTAGYYLPRYGRFEWRVKLVHGMGLWPALWLTAKNGGASRAELDVVELFHAQGPGRNWFTFWGTDNNGAYHQNAGVNASKFTNSSPSRLFFEDPAQPAGWHTWTVDILPVTDATGATLAAPIAASSYVKFIFYLDGVQVWTPQVDSQASDWTLNGGDADSFWNVYMQGCQINGDYVGHPDDYAAGKVGWSRNLGKCISGGGGTGGTDYTTCTTNPGGYPIREAVFPATVEVDYVRCWKYTG